MGGGGGAKEKRRTEKHAAVFFFFGLRHTLCKTNSKLKIYFFFAGPSAQQGRLTRAASTMGWGLGLAWPCFARLLCCSSSRADPYAPASTCCKSESLAG